VVAAALIIFVLHPVHFMATNQKYWYLYYNQLVGGLNGAYGNYETDYYYISQSEASEWLLKYLKEKNIDNAIVAATSSVKWEFRKSPGIKTIYIRNEERSMSDWDYAIIANRYIHPAKLKEKKWPPDNTIHIIYADSVPVCAVLERNNIADYQGLKALEKGNNSEAVRLFNEVLKTDAEDEMIFYNFARALFNDGQYTRADSVLKVALEINPDFEPALMYLGNIAAYRNEADLALKYYERLIRVNGKYFQAYVESAKLLAGVDVKKARSLLRECLEINPGYKPAITGLADTYRKTDPETARKYDEMVTNIK
jgi:tetratricopeptide (TPR) repeat protein